MTSKKLLQTIQGEVLANPPMWLMRQAGRYLPEYKKVRETTSSFLEFCYNPDKATEVTLQPIERFGFDASIIFSDILVIPDAMGMDVSFVKGEGPKLKVLNPEDGISSLSFDKSFLNPVYEAIRKTRAALPNETTLIGFAGAPWTLATYMLEGKSSKEHQISRQVMIEHPEFFTSLMALLIDAVAEHLIAQVEAGVEVLQIFDSWAGSLTEEEFEAWSIAPAKAIIQKVKARFPHIPIIGFPRKAGRLYPLYANETGIDVLGFDYSISPFWIRDHVNIPVQGNLDPLLLALDKERALSKTRELLECFKNKPYIFNLGHGILPFTPIAHVEALVSTVKGK